MLGDCEHGCRRLRGTRESHGGGRVVTGPIPSDRPRAAGYDVIIVGGAIIGSAIAWFLSADTTFDGSVLVVERDMTYTNSSTAHTNSCIRQQFSHPINIQISRFGADYIANFRDKLGGDPDIPDIFTEYFGYLYLAADEQMAAHLRRNQALQAELGAATVIMTPDQIRSAYPFFNVDDIICGSHNRANEGYFDSGTMFEWLRHKAKDNGVDYVQAEVIDLDVVDDRVTAVRLAGGPQVACSTVVNAAGPRAVEVATMAGLSLPVEPRKRFSFVFKAAQSLENRLPLTIDPSGVHVRSDGAAYLAGCSPDPDPAVDYDDFAMDHDIFEDKVWPVLANRIPAFERIKVMNQWAGHYAYNTLDQNVVVGPHPRVENFLFANGFSGHGLQQAPAVGRGVAELICHGGYRSLDLTSLGYQRIIDDRRFGEEAII